MFRSNQPKLVSLLKVTLAPQPTIFPSLLLEEVCLNFSMQTDRFKPTVM